MKSRVGLVVLCLVLLAAAAPAAAAGGILYVDENGVCAGKSPCYLHPQDAVNAASPGNTIMVYPGTYGSRVYTGPPHYGANDQYAPALIVYKDGLTIKAVNPDPSLTVIETTHDWWSNPVAIQASTGGVWNGSQYVGAGVNPTKGTAPNAISIIASGVTIQGFTLRKPHTLAIWDGFWNTAGVMIGGLYAGDPYHLGAANNTVKNCVFEDVWHAVYIWHSSGNQVLNNDVAALVNTGHWAGISIFDGDTDELVALGFSSQNNRIANNRLANKGIFVGAFNLSPLLTLLTDNSGTRVQANSCTSLGVAFSEGTSIFSGNKVSAGYWAFMADDAEFPGNANHTPPAGWRGYGPLIIP